MMESQQTVHNILPDSPKADSSIKVEKVERPTISSACTSEDWNCFVSSWKHYVEVNKVTGKELVTQLLECCDKNLRRDLMRSAGETLDDKSHEDVLKAMKTLAVREENPMVARFMLINMTQDREETVRSFGSRLSDQAGVCKFKIQCDCCDQEVNYTDDILRDVVIRGLDDPDIQVELLCNQNENMTLEQVFQFVETKEAGKRSAAKSLDTSKVAKNFQHFNRKPDHSDIAESNMCDEEPHSPISESSNMYDDAPYFPTAESNMFEEAPYFPSAGMDNTIKTEIEDMNMEGDQGIPSVTQRSNKTFPAPKTLKAKKITQSEKKPYVCTVCNKSFPLPCRLNEHMRGHTGEKPKECDVCGARFRRMSDLSRHRKKHTGETPYDFNVCSDVFWSQTDFVHTGETNHTCQVCSKSFSVLSSLQKHMVTHSEENKVVCKVCGQTFTRRYLPQHMLVHTGVKKHVCEVCGKAFKISDFLKNHMTTHSEERNFVCKVCGQTFKRRDNLYKHMLVHTGVRKHVCKVCGKAFKVTAHLNRHMSTHSEERHLLCKVCGKAFKHQDNLSNHLRIHSDVKKHLCTVCGKAFTASYSLVKHMAIHTGEKRYVCDFCGKAFADKGSLNRHIKVTCNKQMENSQSHMSQSLSN